MSRLSTNSHNMITMCRGVAVMRKLRYWTWCLAVGLLFTTVFPVGAQQVEKTSDEPAGVEVSVTAAAEAALELALTDEPSDSPAAEVTISSDAPTAVAYPDQPVRQMIQGVRSGIAEQLGLDGAAPGHRVMGGLGTGAFKQRMDAPLARVMPAGLANCCRPRWFDVRLEAMNLQRDAVGRNTNFTSDGILGPIVLGVDDLEFDKELGMKFSAARQLFGANSLEFTYFGLFNFDSVSAVNSPTNNLYSVFSNFGIDPFGGFGETDQASRHTLSYSSSIDSVELFIRRSWAEPECRWQGSWHAGVRFVYLLEDFRHTTRSDLNNSSLDYRVKTRNSMVGFQLGADLWWCTASGIRFGAEVKAGVYGNRAEQDSIIDATSITTPLIDHLESKRVSVVVETGAMATWQIDQNWNLRGGYQIVFLGGVALGVENFNTEPPFVGLGRPPILVDNGEALYHGFTVGAEFTW